MLFHCVYETGDTCGIDACATSQAMSKDLAVPDSSKGSLDDRIGEPRNTQVSELGALVSGSQRQRIALARAFVKDAPGRARLCPRQRDRTRHPTRAETADDGPPEWGLGTTCGSGIGTRTSPPAFATKPSEPTR